MNSLKESYDNGAWLKYQHEIESILERAKASMEEDTFLDFVDGVIMLCQDYGGQSNQFESDDCGTQVTDIASKIDYPNIKVGKFIKKGVK